MSDPVGELRRELLAAAERQRHHAAASAVRIQLRARIAQHRLLLIAATLAVAAAAALLVTSPWSSSPGFLERAQAALTPPAATVLHYKSKGIVISRDPACTVSRSTEIWIDQTPPHHYRALMNLVLADPAAADLRTLVCSSGPTTELGGTPDTETLMFVPPDRLKHSPVGLLLAFPPDPVTQLRDAISAGTAHDEGKTQLDGRTVERIRIDPPSACGQEIPGCRREAGYAYVDPKTFYPVEMRSPGVFRPGGGRPDVWLRLVDRFVSFEFLPRTAANLALTNIRAQHPHAIGP
jgi:hypothetical protein